MAVFHQNVILPFCFILQIPQTTVDTIINQENDPCFGNDSNLLIVFYVQIMPDDFVMQLHRF